METIWSEVTAHEGYFDPTNAPAGQCGITSYNYLDTVASRYHRYFRFPDRLQLLYEYGDVIDTQGFLVSDDHCWARIIYGEDDFQIDETPDQFSAQLSLPPLMMQRSGLFDGQPVRHVSKDSTPVTTFDPAKFKGRLFRLTLDKWATDPEYDYPYDVSRSRFDERYRVLKQMLVTYEQDFSLA
jgi:hypothetical protein